MKREARMIIDKDYVIGEVDDKLYGSFIEHLGRADIREYTNPTIRQRTRTDLDGMSLNWSRSLGCRLFVIPEETSCPTISGKTA